MIPSITPKELHTELRGAQPPTILDVREPYELKVSFLRGSVHIPLGELHERLEELDKEVNWVVLCRVGGRSAKATLFLMEHGFTHVRNLTTGINGWVKTVDQSMSEY